MAKKKEAKTPKDYRVASAVEYGFVYISYRGNPSFVLRLDEARELGLALIEHADNPRKTELIPAPKKGKKL